MTCLLFCFESRFNKSISITITYGLFLIYIKSNELMTLWMMMFAEARIIERRSRSQPDSRNSAVLFTLQPFGYL